MNFGAKYVQQKEAACFVQKCKWQCPLALFILSGQILSVTRAKFSQIFEQTSTLMTCISAIAIVISRKASIKSQSLIDIAGNWLLFMHSCLLGFGEKNNTPSLCKICIISHISHKVWQDNFWQSVFDQFISKGLRDDCCMLLLCITHVPFEFG